MHKITKAVKMQLVSYSMLLKWEDAVLENDFLIM